MYLVRLAVFQNLVISEFYHLTIFAYIVTTILRTNCILQQVIEENIKGEIEVTGRRGRRHRKLLDDLNERRGYSNLVEEALDRTMWRARSGRGFVPVVRQTNK
jgi:hypothetical protein